METITTTTRNRTAEDFARCSCGLHISLAEWCALGWSTMRGYTGEMRLCSRCGASLFLSHDEIAEVTGNRTLWNVSDLLTHEVLATFTVECSAVEYCRTEAAIRHPGVTGSCQVERTSLIFERFDAMVTDRLEACRNPHGVALARRLLQLQDEPGFVGESYRGLGIMAHPSVRRVVIVDADNCPVGLEETIASARQRIDGWLGV